LVKRHASSIVHIPQILHVEIVKEISTIAQFRSISKLVKSRAASKLISIENIVQPSFHTALVASTQSESIAIFGARFQVAERTLTLLHEILSHAGQVLIGYLLLILTLIV
jgi:flagellar biosynthesis protein FliQ